MSMYTVQEVLGHVTAYTLQPHYSLQNVAKPARGQFYQVTLVRRDMRSRVAWALMLGKFRQKKTGSE